MNDKRLLHRVAASLFFLQACPAFWILPGTINAEATSEREQEQVRETVKSFLSAWLVERRLDRAMLFFGEAAFANKYLALAPCTDFSAKGGLDSTDARKARVTKFLRYFLRGRPETELNKTLNPKPLEDLAVEFAPFLVNDPKTDLFALTRLESSRLPVGEDEEADHMLKNLPGYFYVCFLSVGQDAAFFVWIPQDGSWRIYHASILCM